MPKQSSPLRSAPRDAGTSLIEMVVAMSLFAVMSTAVLSVLGTAIDTTKDDKSRLQATNLASRELEIVRDQFSSVTRGPNQVLENEVANPSPLPGGTPGQPLVVDNVPYTVTRTARWARMDSTSSPCDDGSSSELAYLHVEVKVRWPALGDRPPVTMDTVMTPPKGTYTTLEGHLGLKVIDSAGRPRPSVPVKAVRSGAIETGITASDGCVLFSYLAPGSWTVTVTGTDSVSRTGDPTAMLTAQVQAGQLWRGTVEYDRAATIVASLPEPAPDFQIPPAVAQLPVTVGNSSLQPIGAKVLTGTRSGTVRTLSGLWAYPSGYDVWVGPYLDGNPGATAAEGRPATAATSAGTTTPVVLGLGAVRVDAAPGTRVQATHSGDRLTTTATTLELGTIDAGGVLRVHLPYGSWTIAGESVLVGPDVTPVVQL